MANWRYAVTGIAAQKDEEGRDQIVKRQETEMAKQCDYGPWNRPCGGKPVAFYRVTFVHPDSHSEVTWPDQPRCQRHDNSWQFKHVHPTKVQRIAVERAVEVQA